jgi:hypothetical protein
MGAGGFWLISPRAVDVLRQAGPAEYPRAAASQDVRFLSGTLIHDLANGTIIDVVRIPPRRPCDPGASTGSPPHLSLSGQFTPPAVS